MNADEAVRALARRAGILTHWTDANGDPQVVSIPVLRRILAALGIGAENPRAVADSDARLGEVIRRPDPLITATVDEPIVLRTALRSAQLVMESGARHDLRLTPGEGGVTLGGIREPGYHALHIGDDVVTLAVAPRRCFAVADIARDAGLWGIAVQLYGLRHSGDGGIGNAAGLSAFAAAGAAFGADAVALSPTHAMFGADLSRYGPYSPSSRLFLNPLYADPAVVFGADRVAAARAATGLAAEWRQHEAADLIDWPVFAAGKLKVFRVLFDGLAQDAALLHDFEHFRRERGDLLEEHALFEVLHAARLAADRNHWNWRRWAPAWRDPASVAVRDFAAAHGRDIAFQAFLQWLADRSLAAAQRAARASGMRIGLIADLAIGMDAGGSHAWSRQHDLLVGLNVGAPPDLFNPLGQDWGLTAFSPRALAAGGFAPFMATLRAVLRNAGGARIDHALGLRRLWLIPEGAAPSEGAYLTYPFEALLRLIALESVRHRAVIIGEDLGTVPKGFREALSAAGIAGMRVLWFERDDTGFLPPQDWPPEAIAMTSTHDLPTVAGWWQGADIEARASLGLLGSGNTLASQRQERARDRKQLVAALRDAGSVSREPADPAEAADAAIRFVAATPADLAVIPLEDVLGLIEQPNMPGTVAEHPNWRRRYPGEAASLLASARARQRAEILRQRRRT
jgi:4-alpha-glucanotransferase